MRECPAIGTKVHAPPYGYALHKGKVLTVIRTAPFDHSMTDTLCQDDDGNKCWYAARTLKPYSDA